MFIHTISIAGGRRGSGVVTATRKSENRIYTACIVVTTTARSVEIDAAHQVRGQEELGAARAKLVRLTAKHGMTLEAATAWCKAAHERWYNGADGFFPTMEKLRAARRAAHGGSHLDRFDYHEAAKADLLRRGFAYEYDLEGPGGIPDSASMIEGMEKRLAGWNFPVPGSQGVVSWHATPALAHKALGSLSWPAKDGLAVEVRTDITVRETQKRAPKGAT